MSSECLRLLLRRAMNPSPRCANRIDVEGNDLATGIKLLQRRLGDGVRSVVSEFGADDPSVADIIVHVARYEIARSRAYADRLGMTMVSSLRPCASRAALRAS